MPAYIYLEYAKQNTTQDISFFLSLWGWWGVHMDLMYKYVITLSVSVCLQLQYVEYTCIRLVCALYIKTDFKGKYQVFFNRSGRFECTFPFKLSLLDINIFEKHLKYATF